MARQDAKGEYLADQVVALFYFIVVFVLFVLQLLVERKAKYDEQQLSAKLRVQEWNLNRRASLRNKYPPVETDRESDSTSGIFESDDRPRSAKTATSPSASALSIQSEGACRARHKKGEVCRQTLKVGPLQWALHRIGLLVCFIQIIMHIDSYSINGILPYPVVSFLSLNASALVFIAAVVCFYYPIHLVRFFALHQRSKPLEMIAVGVSVIIVILSNVIPTLYSIYGPLNYLRGICYIVYVINLLCMSIAFNVYMRQLGYSVDKLIEYHRALYNHHRGANSPANRIVTANNNSNNNNNSGENNSVENVANNVGEPEAPAANFSNLMVMIADTPSLTHSATSPSSPSPNDVSHRRSHSLVVPRGAIGAIELPPVASPTSNTPALLKGPSGITITVEPDPVSQSGAYELYGREASTSTATGGTLSISSRDLLLSHQLSSTPSVTPSQTMRRVYVTGAPSTEGQKPAVPRSPASSVIRASPSTQQRKLAKEVESPAVKQYERMMKKMRKFQVASTLLVILVLIPLLITVFKSFGSDWNHETPLPNADDYASSLFALPYIIAHGIAVALFYWYSYMPISVLLRK